MTNTKNGKIIAFALAGIALLVLPLLLQATGSNSWARIVDLALLYVLLALGLNIVVGYAGLLDLGYIAFYAVGAYIYGLLASPHLADTFPAIKEMFPNGVHVNVWLVMLAAAAIAGLVGMILGAPTLKLRGDYLAIITLGFGEIIRIFMLNLDRPVNITNGPKGIAQIDALTVFGLNMGQRQTFSLGDWSYTFQPVTMYYYLFLFFVLLSVLVSYRLQDSRIGRAWMAIREDEIAAKAMGLNTRNLKLLAFGMGATFGGMSGVLFASFQRFVSPESFSLMESVMVVAMVVLGGIGHIPGVILGALMLAGLPELLRHMPDLSYVTGGRLGPEVLRQLLIALAMVVVMLLRPKGLWPSPEHGKALTK
ncbi:branched-chain amino acid ABC transporter permease [Hydrogenophaga sp. RWCD_12]|uniref:branched-chain amino acid ABC transporter permease n=1 Tax=Hydrogenophaga sp. RWCD_12 TaxID=3391190 RepID=UPI0039851D6B